MALIVLVAIPTYNTISANVRENVYESKVKELLAKGEGYAEENGKLVFTVGTLIEDGKITPDNETGIYKDPRSNRKMNCDIIEVTFEDNHYKGTILESDECFTDEELNNRYGVVEIKVVDATNNEIRHIDGTEWLNNSNVFVTYEFKEAYKNLESFVESISWSGEEEKSCGKEQLSDCAMYSVSTDSTKMVTVGLKLAIQNDAITTTSTYTQNVYLDVIPPEVKSGSVILNNEYSTVNERKVNFEITDYNGSGIKEYALVTEKTCNGSAYNSNKKQANEGVQTEYLKNGTYYICVMDKVGNKTSDSSLDDPTNQIVVTNMDNSVPSVSLNIQSKNTNYHTKDVNLIITASDNENVSNLKMCISNTGYLQNCSWEAYTNTKAWTLSGDYDGGVRTVYITVQDSAGNIGQNSATYTLYKSCSKTTKNYTESAYSSCSKTCGGGTQSRKYQMKDSYLGNVCSSGADTKTCNTQACGPVSYTTNGTTLNLKFDYTFSSTSVTYYNGSYVAYVAFNDEGVGLSWSRYSYSLSGGCVTYSSRDKCKIFTHTAGQMALPEGSGTVTATADSLRTGHLLSYSYHRVTKHDNYWYSPLDSVQRIQVADSITVNYSVTRVNRQDMSYCKGTKLCDSDTMQYNGVRVILNFTIVNPKPVAITANPCNSYAAGECTTNYKSNISELYITNLGVGLRAAMNDGESGDNDHFYGPYNANISAAIKSAIH